MEILLWFGILQVMSWALAPVVASALPRMPDRGYGIARALGWLLTGYFCWLLTAVLHVPSSGLQAWAVLIGLVTVAATPWARRRLQRIPRIEVATVEKIFYGTTILFLIFRACQPEIFWGEKPMDFTFLNYFIRLRDLPPQDPWAAGQAMHYYYFGTYLIALLHKMTQMDPAIGYNVALATLAGLFTSCAYTAIHALCRRRIFAVIGAMALLLLSDWEAFNLTVFQHSQHGFDLFWASSRIMPPAIANEYPLWSFLFADLHAHLIAMPFTIALLALSFRLLGRDKKRFTADKALHLALLGITWGSLLMINSWDFITYGLILGLLFLLRPLAAPNARSRHWLKWAVLGGGTLVLSLAAISPFLKVLSDGHENNGFQMERFAFYTTPEMLRYLGQFLLPILLLGTWVAYRHLFNRWRSTDARAKQRSLWRRFLLPTLIVESVWLCNLGFKLHGIEFFPWSGALAVTVPIFLGSALWFQPRLPRRLKAIGFLIFAFGMLAWLGEFFFVRERLNSLFKLCLPLWTISGIAFAGFLPYLWLLLKRSPLFGIRFRGNIFNYAWQSIMRSTVALFVFVSVVGAIVDISIMTSFQRVHGPRWTLDGLAYLRSQNPEELALINYLRKEVTGTPRIAEAWGDPYGPYTRISMNTGLPTYLGWEHHVKQRGTPETEVGKRKQDLRDLYSTEDAERAFHLLTDCGIGLVVFGSLERSTYGAAGERKFQTSPHFQRLAIYGNEAVYSVLGNLKMDPPRSTASAQSSPIH